VGPRTVLDAVVKRKIPSSLQDSNRRTPHRPARSLVAMPAELSRFFTSRKDSNKRAIDFNCCCNNFICCLKERDNFGKLELHAESVMYEPIPHSFCVRIVLV
jgi:hypothetical protein